MQFALQVRGRPGGTRTRSRSGAYGDLEYRSGRQEPQGRRFEGRAMRLIKVNPWALGAPYHYEARFLGAVALGLVDPL